MKKTITGWTRWIPWGVTLLLAVWILSTLRTPRETSEFNIRAFSQLPVLLNGRIQPLDSVARNSLLLIRAKQSVALDDNKTMAATPWLLEVMAKPEQADQRKIFRIDNIELKGLLKLSEDDKHFSFNEIKNTWEELEKQARRIEKIEAQLRTPYEKGLAKLNFSIGLYFRLKNSLRPENSSDFIRELELFQAQIKPGLLALQQSQAKEEYNEEDLQKVVQFFRRYETLSKTGYPLVVPPSDSNHARDDWRTVGASLMESMRANKIQPAVQYYAALLAAYDKNDPATFNQTLATYQSWLVTNQFTSEITKGSRESFFNHYQPFIKSITLYLIAFLLACASWFGFAPSLNRAAFNILGLAWLVHTSGLIFRMILEGRPPVTNLYSSAIFVGWGSVLLGIFLERIYKDGIGTVVAGTVGFITLVIAHNLSLDGDTMQMLVAVLDTNFWLATHVVVVTLGYAATFLAGFLAIVYILRGLFSQGLNPTTAKSLSRMVYGIICFATLFSFVGTVLGGIWADQSWGRFWGWDPKENGALMIVIWNAAVLHARWGGIIRERGLMLMAVFGNIVTSFSWFGVNMLGVGLHNYGFMDQAFKWLMIFDASQLLLLSLALIPLRHWKSFRTPSK
jgi:ABC-type transport system involved in cytochrome c biogenesis permease subunit